MSTLSNRIKMYLDFKGISQRQFGLSVGRSGGWANNAGKTLNFETTRLITKNYPEVNIDWLLTGKGEMLKTTNTVGEPPTHYSTAKHVEIDNDNTIHASLVSQYAQAGYLNGFGDEEYMETLPKIAFTNGFQAKGNYLCFEVKGDSMDDGSYNSYLEGDILLCREINKEYWKSKLHINKWDFVIVHKDQGIIIKKISDHDVDNGTITIHSLNDFYPDENLHLKDIMQIFNVVNFQRKGNKR